MNNQTNMAQLRYLEELKIGLVHAGFEPERIEDQHLPVSDGRATTSAGSPDGAACCTGRRLWMVSAHRTLCRASSMSLP